MPPVAITVTGGFVYCRAENRRKNGGQTWQNHEIFADFQPFWLMGRICGGGKRIKLGSLSKADAAGLRCPCRQ